MRPISLGMATLTAVIGFSVLSPAMAAPRVFTVSEDMHTLNEAVFSSKASIVRIKGRTSKATGDAKIDLDNLSTASGTINIDVGSFDTGIAMRNDHMRNTIEAAKFPMATLKFTTIKAIGNKLKAGGITSGLATGTMTFHGVTKPVTIPVELTYLPQIDAKYRPGDWIEVHSEFKIKLSDYQVVLPAPVLGVKVSNDLGIEINGMAKAK